MKKLLLSLVLLPMITWGQDTIKGVQRIEVLPQKNTLIEKPKPKTITRDNISFSDYDISFSGVENHDWLSAKDLYDATLTWLADFYEHPKDVLRINTPERIIIEGRTGIHLTEDDDINAIITFEFREGRYKWSINDCIVVDPVMRSLGYADQKIRELPRYNRESAVTLLIYDFSPFVNSFRNKIKVYRPGITPVPQDLSSDW